MAGRSVTVKGPFRGMDLRDTSASDNTAMVAVNVDFSKGTIAARKPMQVAATGLPTSARLHLINRPGVPNILLCVGPDVFNAEGDISFIALDASTLQPYDASYSLAAINGEPVDDGKFKCSFVDTWLNSTTGVPRPVTLIVTENSTYVYEHSVDPGTIRPVDIASDTYQLNGDNFSYWATRPFGAIAVMHQSRVYYMGFKDGQQAVLDNPLEQDQDSVAEQLLGADRATLGLNKATIAWSDEFDPCAIRADHFVSVETGEAVTGAFSAADALYIFTDKSIYALTGYSDETFALQRVVNGTTAVGCTSHQSIVTAGGIMYFMTHSGVHAFGGIAQPELVPVSEGLLPLFNGWESVVSRLPSALVPRLGQYGWPWTAEHADLDLCIGRHNPLTHQIWWSLPVAGPWANKSMPVTMVYDLTHRAWSLYCQSPSPRTGGYQVGCMTDAVLIEQQWVTSNAVGELQLYGQGTADGPSSGGIAPLTHARGVPVFYVSQRHFGEGDAYMVCSKVWFKQLGIGVFTSASGDSIGYSEAYDDLPAWCVEGEEAGYDTQDDLGVEVLDEQERRTRTGALATHPNPSGTYFLGAGVLGTVKPQGMDWFTSPADCGMRSRWFRVSIIDDAVYNIARPPLVCIASYGLEVQATGSAHA